MHSPREICLLELYLRRTYLQVTYVIYIFRGRFPRACILYEYISQDMHILIVEALLIIL
jgi:hypothetical protein